MLSSRSSPRCDDGAIKRKGSPGLRGFFFCRSGFVPFGRDKAYPLLILENVAMTSARSASVLVRLCP